MLKKALRIAEIAHKDQVDKGGIPYIAHPKTVAKMVSGKNAKIVALLHDVCEDSEVTLADLKAEGFSQQVLDAVDAITKREGERYRHYINRVRANRLATTVKIADALHNSDYRRIDDYTKGDIDRAMRYQHTVAFLTMSDEELEKHALQKVPKP